MEGESLIKTTAINSIKGMLQIPFGLISANIISLIVSNASNGSLQEVKRYSLMLIIFIIFYQILLLFINITTQKITEKSSQNFRISIYKSFLDKPFNKEKSTGEIITNFTKDIGEVIKLYTDTFPSIITSNITALCYLVFIGMDDIKLAMMLLAIGFIQGFPPIVIKKFMVKNYNATSEIEGKITDYIVEGYKGIATIKLYLEIIMRKP